MGSGKVVLGVLAGAAVGALFGVLYAPDKGSVTREKMFGDDLEDLQSQFDELYKTIAEKIEDYQPEELVIVETSEYNGN